MTERYKVCVCGSRGWKKVSPILERLKRLPPSTELLIGDAKGGDRIASLVARHQKITQTVYEANWREHGKSAGMRRNLRMLNDQPDLVLAFWDGQSPGTKFMIDEAKKRGIPLEVFYVDGAPSIYSWPKVEPEPLFPYDATIG